MEKLLENFIENEKFFRENFSKLSRAARHFCDSFV